MTDAGPAPGADRRALLQNALQALDEMQAKVNRMERAGREPIAIVGMSCRFPGGADSPEAYWRLLRDGVDAVSEYPAERRAMAEAAGVDLAMFAGDTTWYGGFLDHIDRFDPQFFGISPREAITMDPQQRMVLETSWEALERAGIAPDSLHGSATGVFVGVTSSEYVQLAKLAGPTELDVYSATGGALNAVGGRVAYTLGLQGPCMAIDTACSSSLVALHQACQSLRVGESDMALAGGVNIVLLPEAFISFERWGMMAPDGRCKTFDAAADGFVRGEGCGMLVLKRLSDALADGDPILAVIRGSAVNQDGRSSGLTVPNGPAQQAVLRQALTAAGVQPADVQYFEAHGTGTTLGDPIEVEAIGAVLGRGRSNDQPLLIGSVKTNIGHLESAAGIAGVIKVVLAMQHGAVPAHLHFHERNPRIPWPEFPVVVPTALASWPAVDGRRIVGVSGFGFSGTNAHIVLESAPATRVGTAIDLSIGSPQLLVLSAKSGPALRSLAGRFATLFAEAIDPDGAAPLASLADVCATASRGRAQFSHRLALAATSAAGMHAGLDALAAGNETAGGSAGRAGQPRVAFLFTGQGAQYAGMAQELYASEPAFRDAFDRCATLLEAELEHPLGSVVFAAGGTDPAVLLDQTMYTQPALFAIEYALSELWRSWGIVPEAVVGHSVGEYVAAVVAGVFSLDDGIRLIAARGRLMQQLPAGGAMAAVFAPVDDVAAAVAPYAATLAVAAVNGPAHTVISGRAASVAAVTETFASIGGRVQQLTVSHAFHSPLMQPMLIDFARVAASVTYHRPRLTMVSNLAGEVVDATVATPEHWMRHVVAPVQFAAAMATLGGLGLDTFVEIGPHPVLSTMGQACLPECGAWLPSLRRNRADREQMLASLGQLFTRGARVAWDVVHPAPTRREVLPTTPFQRQRCWIDPVPRARRAVAIGHPLLGAGVHAALLQTSIFETVIAADSPSWMADLRLAGTVIFPGSAYIEMVLAAAGAGTGAVESMTIREALVLPEDGEVTVQTTVVDRSDESRHVQILSRPVTAAGVASTVARGRGWRLHVEGIVRGFAEQTIAPLALDTLAVDFPEHVDCAAYYRQLLSIGLTYGPAFRGLERLMRRDGAAVGLATLAAGIADAPKYRLHPALLDAAFHVLGVAVAPFSDDSAGDMLVPVAASGVRVYQPGATSVWCAATVIGAPEVNALSYSVRLDLYDPAGAPVATVERLDVRRTPRRLLLAEMVERRVRPPARLHAAERSLVDALADAAPRDQGAVLMAYIGTQVKSVLGLDASEAIDPLQGLTDLGMDSLMAVELSNRLRSGVGLALPSTLAFEYPTLAALTDYLGGELLGTPPLPAADELSAGVPALNSAVERVVRLSEEAAAALLLRELEDTGY